MANHRSTIAARSSGVFAPPGWGNDRLQGFKKLIARGDPQAIEWISDLLRDGARLDWNSHLHNAIRARSLPIAKALLRCGASPSAEGPMGLEATPRELASETSGSIFRSYSIYWPSAFEAISIGDSAIFRELIQAGFDPQRRIYSSFSPAETAAQAWAYSSRLNSDSRHGAEILAALQASGCDFSAPCGYPRVQPLTIALRRSNISSAETLLLSSLHRPSSKAMSPLTVCVSLKRPDLLRWLLELGEDPNRPGLPADARESSELHFDVQKALSKNAGFVFGPMDPRSPLLDAVLRKDPEACSILLEFGANPMLAQKSSFRNSTKIPLISPFEAASFIGFDFFLSLQEGLVIDSTLARAEKTRAEQAKKAARKRRKEASLSGSPEPSPPEETPKRKPRWI